MIREPGLGEKEKHGALVTGSALCLSSASPVTGVDWICGKLPFRLSVRPLVMGADPEPPSLSRYPWGSSEKLTWVREARKPWEEDASWRLPFAPGGSCVQRWKEPPAAADPPLDGVTSHCCSAGTRVWQNCRRDFIQSRLPECSSPVLFKALGQPRVDHR